MLELKDVREKVNNPPSIRLKEPVQRGWVRHYVLTKEAQFLADAPTLRQIIEVIGTKEYHWRRDFIKGRRRRPLVEVKHSLKAVPSQWWNADPKRYLEEWKSYFHLEYLPWSDKYLHCHRWCYVFTNVHWFELKVERHWLTHLKVINPFLIERQAELYAWAEHHNGWRRYDRLKGRRIWRPNSNLYRKREAQAKIDLRNYLLSPEEAEVRPSLRWFRFSFFILPYATSPCSPTRRGTPLRTERLWVQILPWGPLSLP